MSHSPNDSLADLRIQIDHIDKAIHELLIERGNAIDRLIEIKSRQGGGSAFRPAREASMMRAIAKRHRGLLPFETVEAIWRIIISTFTYVQAPYSVHIDVSRGDAAMRDSARFHFGFTVPCILHGSPDEVIKAVCESANDLGMFTIECAPENPRVVDIACSGWRAEGDRSSPLRGKTGSSGRDAGLCGFQSIGGRKCARYCPRIGHA